MESLVCADSTAATRETLVSQGELSLTNTSEATGVDPQRASTKPRGDLQDQAQGSRSEDAAFHLIRGNPNNQPPATSEAGKLLLSRTFAGDKQNCHCLGCNWDSDMRKREGSLHSLPDSRLPQCGPFSDSPIPGV